MAASLAPAHAAIDPRQKSALLDLAASTQSVGWNLHGGNAWVPSTDPCTGGWYGVTCDVTTQYYVTYVAPPAGECKVEVRGRGGPPCARSLV